MVDAIRIGRDENILKQAKLLYGYETNQGRIVRTIAQIEGSNDLLVVFNQPIDKDVVTFSVCVLSIAYICAVNESDITMVNDTMARVRG